MPRITDFELQTQSGQLWIDIQERLTTKDAEHAGRSKAKDEEHSKTLAAKEAALKSAADTAAAELAKVKETAAAELAAVKSDLSTAASALASMDAYKAEMVFKVKAALESNNPETFQAVAVEFLTPEDIKERNAKLAEIDALETKLAAMKAEVA